MDYIKFSVTIYDEEQDTKIVRSMKVITQTTFYRFFLFKNLYTCYWIYHNLLWFSCIKFYLKKFKKLLVEKKLQCNIYIVHI